jgi:hypothetical protein
VILFDGTYSWQGKTTARKRPISWWRSAYQLRIIDISRDGKDIVFLKPHLVLFADTGQGASVTNCLPELAKRICEDFDLDLNRVVWVEERPEADDRYRVAMFRPVARLSGEAFYQVVWRMASPGEQALIAAHLG